MGLALQIVVLMTLSVTFYAALTAGDINVCDPAHHETFKDPRRSIGYDLRASDTPLTDSNTDRGFYRFLGVNGEVAEMPTKCPGYNVCGTNSPIWANCTFPTGLGNVSICHTCAKTSSDPNDPNCCQHKGHIYIHKCNGFFVYDLSLNYRNFSIAFCAGTSKRCPVGKRSATGFEPCTDASITLTQNPTITVNERTFDHTCTFVSPSTDASSTFNVTWTINGKPVLSIPVQVLTGRQRSVTLAGDKLKSYLNTEVGCQVDSYVTGYPDKKNTYQSPTKYHGAIDLDITPDKLDITAGGGEKEITITSKTPLSCLGSGPCCVTFKVTLDKQGVVAIKNNCGYKLCASDWNAAKKQAQIKIVVTPTVTAIASGIARVGLTIGNVEITGTGRIAEIFRNFRPIVIPIAVQRQSGYTCSLTGDPHITSFDKAAVLDHYQVGDYTAVQIRDRDFTVQIRTWKCWAVTCICGIVIKERNDVVRIFGCDKRSLTLASVQAPYQLSGGVSVQRSSCGRRIGVRLSSGSEIKIELSDFYINLYIQIPASDRAKTVGLCGINDGNKANDLTYPGGRTDPQCTGNCINNAFVESWRVTGTASMIQVTPKPTPVPPITNFCACNAGTNGISNSQCTPKGDTPDSGTVCWRCTDITTTLVPTKWGDEPGKDLPKIPPVSYPKTWPSINGVTKANADAMCNAAIRRSPLYNQCKDVTDIVINVMLECLGDILFGGLTQASRAVTESFTSKCQANRKQKETCYLPGPDGPVLGNDTLNLCSDACTDHGTCQNGKCVCNYGWKGESCLIDSNKGPQINYIPGKWGCISRNKPCDAIEFDKSNVDIFAPIKCRIKRLTSWGEIGDPKYVDAIGPVSSSVTCPIPPMSTIDEGSLISIASEDGKYGNELKVFPLPNSCLECTQTSCKIKSNVCKINNICYENGKVNYYNPGEICNYWKNKYSWSPNTDEQC